MSLPNTPETFWARVRITKPDECWEWQGAITSGGYGNLSYQGVSVVAHRVAYHLSHNTSLEAPADKLSSQFVLHDCDNRICCNPNHLHLGTLSTNQKEAYARKRRSQPKGENHANAKLTATQASAVKVRNFLGERQVDLAVEFGVSQRVVSLISRSETYK